MTIYTKICSTCKFSKSIAEFSKKKDAVDGHRSNCKSCVKKYYQDNKEAIAGQKRKYYQDNKEEKRKYYQDNKEAFAERNRKYRQDNKEAFAERNRKYRQDNKEVLAEKQRKYREDNKEAVAERDRKYRKIRSASDPLFRLSGNIRSLIRMSFINNGFKKNTRTAQILGCSVEEFKIHIENQFTEGMSWENRSLWHLDHITPVSWGKTEEEIIALNHYTNFQPLWAENNLKKGNRFSG